MSKTAKIVIAVVVVAALVAGGIYFGYYGGGKGQGIILRKGGLIEDRTGGVEDLMGKKKMPLDSFGKKVTPLDSLDKKVTPLDSLDTFGKKKMPSLEEFGIKR